MDKIIKLAPPVVGVVAGQTATLDLPIGPRYHALWLKGVVKLTSGTPVLSDIFGLINIKINGQTVRAHTADELDQINTLISAKFAVNSVDDNSDTGNHKVTFYLPIFFAEPFRKSWAGTELASWPTMFTDGKVVKKLDSFQIEIAVPNTASTSLHAIEAYAETDAALGRLDASGAIQMLGAKWQRQAVPYTASGELYITNLNKAGMYQEIHAFAQGSVAKAGGTVTDTITNAKVTVDGRIIRDVPVFLNNQTLVGREFNEAGLNASFYRFDLVFDYSDLPSDGLFMGSPGNRISDFQVILTLGAAGNTSKLVNLVSVVYDALV